MAFKTPPVLPGLPVLGNVVDFQKDRQKLIAEGYARLGPIFTIKLGPRPVAVLIGPEAQKFFFMETDKTLSIDKPYEMLKAMFGEVAFLASPAVYQEQRPILHSPFAREKMIKYLNIMQHEVQKWLDGLGESGRIDLAAEMGTLVQNVAGNALMGPDFLNKVGAEFWELYGILGKSLDLVIPPDWPTPKNRRRDLAKARMREILEPIIEERRRHPDEYDDFLQDFINTPLRSGGDADTETIVSLLRGLMFASHETTAGQAAWTIIELLRYPEYLAIVQDEINLKAPAGTALDGSVLRSLEHVAWAVQEIERLHPSADVLMRVAEEDVVIEGYTIPKDWYLLVSPALAHRLPEYFKDPEVFDPLRFAPDRQEDRQHRFVMIGFGGGIHKCAGMNFANNEMMVITTLLLQQFDLELETKNPGVNYGLGASRPETTFVRYKRKSIAPETEPEFELVGL
jgi:sterol 14alpha-demethylase